jgi:hypothetical protein
MFSYKKTLATCAGVLALTAPLASAATNRLATSTKPSDASDIDVLRLVNDGQAPGEYALQFDSVGAIKFAAACSAAGAPIETKLSNQIEDMIRLTTANGPKSGTIDCMLQAWINDATPPKQRKYTFDAKPDVGNIKINYDREAKTKKNPRVFKVKSEGAKDFNAACQKQGGKVVQAEFSPVKNGESTMTLVGAHNPDVVDCVVIAENDNTTRARHFRSYGK